MGVSTLLLLGLVGAGATGACPSRLETAIQRDQALRKDANLLKFRHNIERVIGAWSQAAHDCVGQQKLRAQRGESEAWALMAHWSGAPGDRRKAARLAQSLVKPKAKRVPAVAKKTTKTKARARNGKVRRLNRVHVKQAEGSLEIRIDARGSFDMKREIVPQTKHTRARVFVDLTPVVAVRRALGKIAVDHPDVVRVRVGQYDPRTARIVFDFDPSVKDFADRVELRGEGTIRVRLGVKKPEPAKDLLSQLVDKLEEVAPKEPSAPKGSAAHKKAKAKKTEAKKAVVQETGPSLAQKATAASPAKKSAVSPKASKRRRRGAGLFAIKRIVIDAGHGGRDSGAIGHRRLREKDVNLGIAKALGRALKQRLGVKVIYTRNKDEYVSLRKRTAIANRSKADLFISVHANANRNRKIHGVETYYLDTASSRYAERLSRRENRVASRLDRTTPDDSTPANTILPDGPVGRDLRLILADLAMRSATLESKRMAGYVQRSLVSNLRKVDSKVRDYGVKHALFYVLLGARMPSILIETGFVTNPTEGKRLASKKHQVLLANAIADGVERFVTDRKALLDEVALNGGEGGLIIGAR